LGLIWACPEAVAGEIDAMGVVNEVVEDGVGTGRVAGEGLPFVDGIWLVRMAERRP
jgi:hypothetical protein